MTPPIAQETAKIEQPGNAAAMREALKAIERLATEPIDAAEYKILASIAFAARAALSAPARNCDRYATEDAAREAFDAGFFGPTDFGFYEAAFIKWLFAKAQGGAS